MKEAKTEDRKAKTGAWRQSAIFVFRFSIFVVHSKATFRARARLLNGTTE